jgi:hypothetical protein
MQKGGCPVAVKAKSMKKIGARKPSKAKKDIYEFMRFVGPESRALERMVGTLAAGSGLAQGFE